jgi:glucose/arabinose dehydrogenase
MATARGAPSRGHRAEPDGAVYVTDDPAGAVYRVASPSQ